MFQLFLPRIFSYTNRFFFCLYLSSISPDNGNASSVHAFGLMGLSPPCGSHTDALFGCDGSRLCFRFYARPETGHKYHCTCRLSSVVASAANCIAASESRMPVGFPFAWLIPSDNGRNVKGALIFNCFCTFGDLKRKPPHFLCRSSEGAAHPKFLIF